MGPAGAGRFMEGRIVSRVTRRIAGFAVLGFMALPLAALASHGKVGLWEVTTTMNMPNMPQMSPTQMAQMQAMGMHMPMGHEITVQRCMSAAEVASDVPPAVHHKNCTMSNVTLTGHTFSGKLTCLGEFTGTGTFSINYDSDTHFSGTETTTGTAGGHSATSSASFEGKWISADCVNLK